jgi:hypothetical protein
METSHFLKGLVMQKQFATNFRAYEFGEAALAASRQVWLAGLGATVVTRDWVQSEAGHVFKTLVKEGAVVESRAIRFFGDQFETSLARANTAWKQTRRTVESTVKQAATSVVDYAQQALPKSLPKIELRKLLAPTTAPAPTAKRAKKAVKARAAKPAGKAKRTTARRATKRA